MRFTYIIISVCKPGLQVDMRDFINAPNGSTKQSLAVNEKLEADPSQSPLGGRTVWQLDDAFYLLSMGQERYDN